MFNIFISIMFNNISIHTILYTLFISYVTYKLPIIVNKTKHIYKIHVNKLAVVKKEKKKAVDSIKSTFFHNQEEIIKQLENNSTTCDDILTMVNKYKNLTKKIWKDAKISGTVYTPGNEELNNLILETYKEFQYSNPLHIDVFPGLQIMEASIVNMCLNLYKAPKNAIGNITSGGTESIFMACKAYRDFAKEVRGIQYPEIIISSSAHVAFKKSAHYLNIKIVELKDHPITKKLDVSKLSDVLNHNTILVVASAPSFANGVIDPLNEISDIVLKYDNKIGIHLDACLGGFLLPFMDIIYNYTSNLNFNTKGLTSISMDTHKYGCSPKGTSIILYRNTELAHYQYFVDPNWIGGIYISPTLAGSRSGELIAGTWATMMYFGKSGYIKNTNKVLEIVDYIYKKLIKIDEIKVIVKPEVSIVSFTTKNIDIYLLCQEMDKKGWSLNTLQFPSSAHICITPTHTNISGEQFIKDIQDSINYIIENKLEKPDGVFGIYGSSQAIPDRDMIKDIGYSYLDAYYNC